MTYSDGYSPDGGGRSVATGVGPNLHPDHPLFGQPVPLVVLERNPDAPPERRWRWRCRYVDGADCQHSSWHYSIDDTGWGRDYAIAFDGALVHVMLHLEHRRVPGRRERLRLWLRARRRERTAHLRA